MTREELVQSARKLYDSEWPNEILKEALEETFPELKESEDERIRKRAIAILKQQRDFWSYDGSSEKFPPSTPRKDLVEAIDTALSYLEKQKEQKPVEKPSKEEYVKRFKALCDAYEIKLPNREYDIYHLCDDLSKLSVDSGKQKYAEWGEGDEKIFNTTITHLLSYAYPNNPIYRKEAEKCAAWLKSLSERFNLQPKQEWGEDWQEEDIQTRFAFYTYKNDPSTLYLSNVFVEEASRNYGFGTRILRAAEKVAETIGATTISLKVKQDSPANAWYRKNGFGYVTFEDGYDWLEKNLEYMKPTKSAEWSEEDERMRKAVLDEIEHQIEIMPDADDMDSDDQDRYNELISMSVWMEDLPKCMKPHWKPSEEQMAVLEIACKYEGVFTQGQLSMLLDLKEQLKKL